MKKNTEPISSPKRHSSGFGLEACSMEIWSLLSPGHTAHFQKADSTSPISTHTVFSCE